MKLHSAYITYTDQEDWTCSIESYEIVDTIDIMGGLHYNLHVPLFTGRMTSTSCLSERETGHWIKLSYGQVYYSTDEDLVDIEYKTELRNLKQSCRQTIKDTQKRLATIQEALDGMC